jgi:rhamnosyltransferase
LEKIISSIPNKTLISLSENIGIAEAQNIGIRKLNCSDEELILFFDQDSSISENFLISIKNEYQSLEKSVNNSVILGPTFYHRTKNFEYPVVKFNRFGFRKKIYVSNYPEAVEASCIISSGMCVRKGVLSSVGEMDRSLFIDYVDTEWCLRAVSKGVKIYVSPHIVMEHEIGNDNIKVFRWRVPVHSATRRYYRIRNSFILFKYPYIPFVVSLHELSFSIIHQFFLILFVKNKRRYMDSLIKGMRDGIVSLFKSKN